MRGKSEVHATKFVSRVSYHHNLYENASTQYKLPACSVEWSVVTLLALTPLLGIGYSGSFYNFWELVIH